MFLCFYVHVHLYESVAVAHQKNHAIEKKVPIEKTLTENLNLYSNTMNSNDDEKEQNNEINGSNFNLSNFGLTRSKSIRQFFAKDATMWKRRKDAKLNKFTSAINFNVIRNNIVSNIKKTNKHNQTMFVRSRSNVPRSSVNSATGARKSIQTSIPNDKMPEQMIEISKCTDTAKLQTKSNTNGFVFDRIMKKVATTFAYLGIEKMEKPVFKMLMNQVITFYQQEKTFKLTTGEQRSRKATHSQHFQLILDEVHHFVKYGSNDTTKDSNPKVIGTFHQKSSVAKVSEAAEAKTNWEALLNRNMTKYSKIYDRFFVTIANSKHKSYIDAHQIASSIKLGCNSIDTAAINFILQWFQLSQIDTTENGLKKASPIVTFSDCFSAHLANVHILLKNDFFMIHDELERQAQIAAQVNNQPRKKQRYQYESTSIDNTLTIDAPQKLIDAKLETKQGSRYQYAATSRSDYQTVSSNNTSVRMYTRPVDATNIHVKYSNLSYLENVQQSQFDVLLWLAVVFDCHDLVNEKIFSEWQESMLGTRCDSDRENQSLETSESSTMHMSMSSDVSVDEINNNDIDIDAALTTDEFKQVVVAKHLNLQYFDHFRTNFVDDMFATLFQVMSKHGRIVLTSHYLKCFFGDLSVDAIKLEEYGDGIDSQSFEKCLNAAFDFYDTQQRELITSSDLMIFENSHLSNLFAPDLDKMFQYLFSEHFDQLVTSKECGISRKQFYSLFESDDDSDSNQNINKFNIPQCCKVFDT